MVAITNPVMNSIFANTNNFIKLTFVGKICDSEFPHLTYSLHVCFNKYWTEHNNTETNKLAYYMYVILLSFQYSKQYNDTE